jgi:hypothetical protein
MSENVTNEENKTKVVGFKVTPHKYNVLKQYTAILHNQMIQDPETGQPRRMSERPEVGLLIGNAIYSYLVQYQYMMQQQAKLTLMKLNSNSNSNSKTNKTRCNKMVKKKELDDDEEKDPIMYYQTSLAYYSINLYKRLIGVSTIGYLYSRFISILANPFFF